MYKIAIMAICFHVFCWRNKMKRTTSENVAKKDNQQTNSEDPDDPNQSAENEEEESFSLTKSAIDDLPSTAVQSIHLEVPEGQPSLVENVDEEAFLWKEYKMKWSKVRKQRKSFGPTSSRQQPPPVVGKQRSITKQQQQQTPQRIATNSGNVIVANNNKQQQPPTPGPKRNSSQQTIKTVEQNRKVVNQANSVVKSKERRDNVKKNKKRK
nr:uncharacterized protein LOC124496231 [Dermatophagoides farinae]